MMHGQGADVSLRCFVNLRVEFRVLAVRQDRVPPILRPDREPHGSVAILVVLRPPPHAPPRKPPADFGPQQVKVTRESLAKNSITECDMVQRTFLLFFNFRTPCDPCPV